MVAHHIHTGPGGTYNYLGILEYLDKMACRRPSLPAISGIKGRLTATGLICGTVQGHALSSQNFHHRLAHFRVDGVNQALNEKGRLFVFVHARIVSSVSRFGFLSFTLFLRD